ncbi:MAG: DUF4438 domain-containing protein [Calditrichaeota bacterium]|nr:MAG: DUF4438 domain-containing protein [Calditrichota bacterium]
MAVVGEISHPTLRKTGYVVTAEGKVAVYPSVGGITYNQRIGDSAVDLMADHVEPGVSIRNTSPGFGEYSANSALNVLSCVGNRARVISGDAKGAIGYVTGKHGGIDHVMVDFPADVLEKLVIGDRILVEAWGVGLQLTELHPQVLVMNLDPDLLERLPVQRSNDGYLEIGVTHQIPAQVMGSGLGQSSAYSGDYDIQMFDQGVVERLGLNRLRFGDLVAIQDSDASHGWIYREGAITVGVVAHSCSVVSGHGPGVTTLFTSPSGKIRPKIDPEANLKQWLFQ